MISFYEGANRAIYSARHRADQLQICADITWRMLMVKIRLQMIRRQR